MTKPTKQQVAQAKARAGGNNPIKLTDAELQKAGKLLKTVGVNAAMIVGPGKFIKGAQMTAKAIALAKASVKGTENVRKAAAAARAAKSAEVVAARETTRAKLKSNAIARKTEDRANASAAKSGRVRTEPKPKDPARQIRQNQYQREDTRQANALSDVNPNTVTVVKKTAPASGPKFLGKLPEQTGKPSTRSTLKGRTLGAGHLTPRIKPKPEVTHAAIPSGRLSIPSSHAPRPPKPKVPDTGATPSKAKRTQEVVLKPGQNTGKPSRVVTHVQAHKVTKSEVGRSPYGRLPDVSRLTPKPPKVEAAEVVVRSTGRKPLTKEQLAKRAQGIAKTKTKRVFKGLRGRGR